jgi:hypothetical protein
MPQAWHQRHNLFQMEGKIGGVDVADARKAEDAGEVSG